MEPPLVGDGATAFFTRLFRNDLGEGRAYLLFAYDTLLCSLRVWTLQQVVGAVDSDFRQVEECSPQLTMDCYTFIFIYLIMQDFQKMLKIALEE